MLREDAAAREKAEAEAAAERDNRHGGRSGGAEKAEKPPQRRSGPKLPTRWRGAKGSRSNRVSSAISPL